MSVTSETQAVSYKIEIKPQPTFSLLPLIKHNSLPPKKALSI